MDTSIDNKTAAVMPTTEKTRSLSESKGKTELMESNYHGIDTTAIPPGTDAVYERKIAIMNQALIDLGMGPFQWKIFAMTGFGWFVDNVSLLSESLLSVTDCLVLDASHHHHQRPCQKRICRQAHCIHPCCQIRWLSYWLQCLANDC